MEFTTPHKPEGSDRKDIGDNVLVTKIFANAGIKLPYQSMDQCTIGYDVPRGDFSQWVPGDRLYFACDHPEIDHTGMYIGNGYFIHAATKHSKQVVIERVDDEFYGSHLVAVRRSKELLGETPQPLTHQSPNP